MTVMIAAAAIVPAAAQGRRPEPPPTAVIVTTGEGIVKRAADRAWVSISAESRARTPATRSGRTPMR